MFFIFLTNKIGNRLKRCCFVVDITYKVSQPYLST